MQLDKIAFFVSLAIGCAELGLLNLVAVPAVLRERARAPGAVIQPARATPTASAELTERRERVRARLAATASASPPATAKGAVAPLGSATNAGGSLRELATEGAEPDPDAAAAGAAPGAAPPAPDWSITFRAASRMYTREGRLAIFALARRMKAEPGLRVRLVGHTDARGDPEENDRLSHLRAEVVTEFLVVLGVDRSRISVKARGGREPLDASPHPEAQASNRRVEAFLEPDGGTL